MIHLITGEYPPAAGGVSDYSALVAARLADCGQLVHVWTGGDAGVSYELGVTVHRIAGRFSPLDIARLDRELNTMPGARRLLVQWTPHSFGFHSLNANVPAWLWKRAKADRDRVELMVHEPFLAWESGRWRQNAAASVHRLMISTLLDAASKVWVAIPAWEKRLTPWCFGKRKEFAWLPVPSNIDERCEAHAVLGIRSSVAPQRQPIVGHFGTYRSDVAGLLAPAVSELLKRSNSIVLLTGSGSIAFGRRFRSDRVLMTGALEAKALAEHLSACDVLLQPYPDGISTRRGSTMAALALGLPMVTNLGHLSEEFWTDAGAVQLALSSTPQDLATCALRLIQDRDLRLQTSEIARDLYRARFDVRHTVDALLGRSVPFNPRAAKAVA